jgi:hypothetical protein
MVFPETGEKPIVEVAISSIRFGSFISGFSGKEITG